MHLTVSLRKVAVLCLVMALIFATGCNALGLQDWQRDIVGLGLNAGIGFLTSALLIPFQSTDVQVERNCFENGEPIDCALLPNGGAI